MKMYLTILISIIVMYGCEYVDNKQFKVKTVEGEVIELSCPVIDPHKNSLTYFHDGYCYMVKK